LEETLKIIWFQPPCHEQGHLPLDQVAQSSILTSEPLSCLTEGGSRWGHWCCLCLCGCSECCLSVVCVAGNVYTYIRGVYVCALCACSCWEYIFCLATGWTQGHGAAAASPLAGCRILHDTFCSNKL